jgi:prepilin-type N-terminal cleavage/methylation domain-containing protein
MTCSAKRRQRGFTLAELAVVLLIVGLLLGSFIGTYSTQVELSRISDTRRTLETARDALLGFAAANGRLPCPAVGAYPPKPTDSGVESPANGGVCTAPYTGYLPAATLGLSPADAQGFLLDAWGNRILYAVSSANISEFTTEGQIRSKLLDLLSSTPGPDLQVCNTAAGITGAGTPTAACPPAVAPAPTTALTTTAAAVIFSAGKNRTPGGYPPTGTDEAANLPPPPNPGLNTPNPVDRVFVSHVWTPGAEANLPGTSASNYFDDIVIWVSPAVLYNRILNGAL